MSALTDDRRFVDLDDADAALELLSQAVFASGMGMSVVESKWDGICDAFHGSASIAWPTSTSRTSSASSRTRG